MKELVYLAIPYSHPDPKVSLARFELANKIAAKLMNQGALIYSPISHTHPIALAGKLPLGWEFWHKYDTAMLKCCYKIIVITADGWETSKGVTSEIKIAMELGLKIEYLDPDNEEGPCR